MGKRREIEPAFRTWLESELQAWQQSGLITQPQAEAILSQYAGVGELAAQRRNWFLFTLWGCAAVLFGAAVFLLVSFNWAQMPAALKLMTIFGVLAGTYALGILLWRRPGWQRTAEVVFFLGGLFYGAAIWLVAQVFHMDAHYPDAFFWWAVGVLPLALLLDSLLLHALLVAVLGTWISTEVLGYGHLPALLFGIRWNWLPNGAYWAPLMALPGLWLCYRRQSFWGVTFYAPLLAWWAILQPIAWHWDSAIPYFVGAVGALFLIVAESHPCENRLAIPFRFCGALLFGGALIPLSYYHFNRFLWNNPLWGDQSEFAPIGAAVVISVWAGLALAISEGLRYRFEAQGREQATWQLDDIRRRQWAPLGMAAFMAILSLWSIVGRANPDSYALPPTLLANIAMVGTSLWLMYVGLREDRVHPLPAASSTFCSGW